MMCFSRPKSRIRVDDLMDGLILQIMTTIERKSSARAKAVREGLERPVLRSSARLGCDDELGNFGRCFLNCHAFPL